MKISYIKSCIKIFIGYLSGNKAILFINQPELSNTSLGITQNNNISDSNVLLKNTKESSSVNKGKGIDRPEASNPGNTTQNANMRNIKVRYRRI